jgi:hypothetical protein
LASYEHSQVFDQIKISKESITTNYTSLQYLQTLDSFIWKSLHPIATECPSLFYTYFAKVVARQSLRSSAKFTSNDRQKLPIQLFNALIAEDQEKAFTNIREMYINRGLLFGLVGFFLRYLKTYTELQFVKLKPEIRRSITHRIETNIGLRPQGNLYQAIQETKFWDTKAIGWKNKIIEKYARMTIMNAQRTYKDFSYLVKLDDIVQIYMVIVSRSVDRCDPRQGVLTTFIQNWYKSAKGEVAQLAQGTSDSSYEGLIEEHGDAVHDFIGVTNPDVESELWAHVAYVAYCTDPHGLVRTSLGIPQYVSPTDRQLLEALVYEPS